MRADTDSWKRAWWLTAGLVGAYLLWPMVQASHIEVLTAQMAINAMAANEGRLAEANVLYPIHMEYFYLSRQGVVYLLQALMRWFGNGDFSFRLLTQVSFLVYIGSAIATAGRFAGVSLWAAGAALLITPGIATLGFFFNDNVVSVAFGLLAVVALPRPLTVGAAWWLRAVGTGLLLGFAILSRLDSLLLLPAVAGMCWIEGRSARQMAKLAATAASSALAVLLVSFWLSGYSILDGLRIARHFDGLPTKFRDPAQMLSIAVLFFGPLSLLLLPVGASRLYRDGNLRTRLVLVALPLAMFLYFVRHGLVVRHFYPLLAPFVAILGGLAIQRLWSEITARVMSRWAWVTTVAAAIVMFSPPVYVPIRDGPRPLVGQFWAPLLWNRWHDSMRSQIRQADQPGAAAESEGRSAVITMEGNADAFVRLRLWTRGFRPVPAQGCRGAVEGWQRGDRQVLMARTENPHLMAREDDDYVLALLLQRAFTCPALQSTRPIYVMGLSGAPQSLIMQYGAQEIPALVSRATIYAWPVQLPGRFLPLTQRSVAQRTVLLTPAQVVGLRDAADREVARHPGPLPAYEGVMAEFSPPR